MSTCPQCAQENKDEARFCVKCGASLETPVQPGVAPPGAQPPVAAAPPPLPPQAPPATSQPAPPTQPAQPTYQQPAPYAQSQYAATPQPPYPAPPVAQAYAAPARTRGPLFWIGTFIVLVAGVLVLTSTWMSWGSGPAGYLSLSGWDWFSEQGKTDSLLGQAIDLAKEQGDTVNPFFVMGDYISAGYPIFTGLCSIILGGLLILIAILMLIFRSRGLGGIAILFSIFALGMAITNTVAIVGLQNISLGVGMYLFLVFSFAGLVGGGMAVSG